MASKYEVGDIIKTDSGNLYKVFSIEKNCYLLKVVNKETMEICDINWNPNIGYVDSRSTLYQEDTSVETSQNEPIKIDLNPVTLQDYFKIDLESKKPRYTGQALAWLKEGRCPHCGEMGRYHLSTAICSKHGPY